MLSILGSTKFCFTKLLSSLAKLLSSFPQSSLGETAEQFGETAGQTADDVGEILIFFITEIYGWYKKTMGIPKKCYNLAVSGHQSEKYSS